MEKNNVKDKRTTFRMTADDYDRFTKDAADCGMDLSTYIRKRISDNLTHIFYDPAMIAEIRAYRDNIRGIARDIETIRHKVDADNYVQTEEINKVHVMIKSVYLKMDELEHSIHQYREEIENGYNQTA